LDVWVTPDGTAGEILKNSDGGTCDLIQIEGVGCTISLAEDDAFFWPVEFTDGSSGAVHYDYHGSWTEIPQEVAIPCDLAIEAFKSFFIHGSIPPNALPLIAE
jgi:hypothetical protein